MRKIYNPKMVRMMWVPGHAGIQENEKADQHANAALQGETNKNCKTVAKD
jgi:ribonuclease HI